MNEVTVNPWSRAFLRALPLALIFPLLCPTAGRTQTFAGPLQGFEPFGRYELVLDGVTMDARVLRSERDVSYLIFGEGLSSPLLLSLADHAVYSIDPQRLEALGDGAFDLAPSSSEGRSRDRLQGPYVERREAYLFAVDGEPAELRPKAPLLGRQTQEALRLADPQLVHGMAKLARQRLEQPAKGRDLSAFSALGGRLRLLVFFNQSCGICGLVLPRIFQAESELTPLGSAFEYYALPQRLRDDPLAEQLEIRGVPTAVVFLDGEPVGQLRPLQLQQPMDSLAKLLGLETP